MSKIFWLFISLSVFCFVGAGFFTWQAVSPSVAATPSEIIVSDNSDLKAVSLSIPTLNLNLIVSEGDVKNNRWPTSTKGLIHVSSTKLPGVPGNAVIYGHNWKSLLGDLSRIKLSDTIEVTLSDGSKKTFVVDQIAKVSPDQNELLQDSIDSRLTLYTCSGFLDSKRLVVVAHLSVN